MKESIQSEAIAGYEAQLDLKDGETIGLAIERLKRAESYAREGWRLVSRILHERDEMRAALKGLLRHCVTPGGFPDKENGRTDEQQAAYDAARTVLAKMEG